MTRHVLVLVAFLVLPALAATTGGTFHEPIAKVPDRVIPLVMSGTGFNGLTYPNTPLIEAFLGERIHFIVTVPITAEPHTFHMHGHPWLADKGDGRGPRMFDTWLLKPGESHRFDVTAGGVGRNAGDWMYHCHFDQHMQGGMWGIFRVYEYSAGVLDGGPLGGRDAFHVALDRLGVPVDDAVLRLEVDGQRVSAIVRPEPDVRGVYRVEPLSPLPNTGNVAIIADHGEFGGSIIRHDLGTGGRVDALLSDVVQGDRGHAHSATSVVVPPGPNPTMQREP